MKNLSTLPVSLLSIGVWLILNACAALTAPVATEMIGGAELAIKGAELQKEITKADVQEAIDAPFEMVWDVSLLTLVNLDVEITKNERNPQDDGAVIEGLIKKRKVKVIVAKLTEKITEIGIWAGGDKALAGLIARKISEEANQENRETKQQNSG